MRIAARVDANQAQIVAALRKAGASDAKNRAALENLKKATAANAGRVYGIWRCSTCGAEKPATANQKKKTYCSVPCMAEGYKTRLQGSQNPNYRATPTNKICAYCSAEYQSYKNDTTYCKKACYDAVRTKPKPMKQLQIRYAMPKPVKVPKVPTAETCMCLQCGAAFKRRQSSVKKYCTYACHLLSGGAQRAGNASARMKMKYGAKKDANHNELMEVLRQHCAVFDMSNQGCGVPDGIAYINGGWQWFDIKNPKTSYGRRGLNPVQKKWIAQVDGRAGPVYLLYTIEEAERFGKGQLENIKYEGKPVHVVNSVAQALEALNIQGVA